MELKEINEKFEQRDIEYLQNELEKIHYDLYRNVSKETLTNSLQKAAEVDSKLFIVAVEESLALIGDAHTHTNGILNDNYLPLELREIDGGYYIVGSSNRHESLLGKKVIAINGFSIAEIEEKVSNLSSKENIEVLKKNNAVNITSNLVLKYYGFSNDNKLEISTEHESSVVEINTKDRVKLIRPLKWTPKVENDPTFYGNEIYRLRMIGDTLLFQYNQCTNENHSDEELSKFKTELLQRAESAKRIIVDLRQNGGGNTEIMKDAFQKFPNEKELYVAMGRETFSSAVHHLLYLKRNKSAVLIGENAGQKPNRFGDHKKITLPNSKLRINCSYKYFELLPGQNIDVIEPDIAIPVTIEDYKNSRDPLNQWIKNNFSITENDEQ